MIVEDQALLALDLEMTLADAGCAVVGCAMDTPGALVIGARDRPDLALVDINLLDGVTGPSIAERLVQDHGTAVVFLTANLEQIPEGYAGALGALSKPFDEETIRAVLAFVESYRRDGTVGAGPRRLRLAPWLVDRARELPGSVS